MKCGDLQIHSSNDEWGMLLEGFDDEPRLINDL